MKNYTQHKENTLQMDVTQIDLQSTDGENKQFNWAFVSLLSLIWAELYQSSGVINGATRLIWSSRRGQRRKFDGQMKIVHYCSSDEFNAKIAWLTYTFIQWKWKTCFIVTLGGLSRKWIRTKVSPIAKLLCVHDILWSHTGKFTWQQLIVIGLILLSISW